MSSEIHAASHDSDEQHAPRRPIPSRSISVVEHPCIIKNIDKGITSLGGPIKLSKVSSPVASARAGRHSHCFQGLRSQLETTTNVDGDDVLKKLISVSLRPDDPLAKRLLSTPVRTNNLLIKITVPKRTGRKRKRGSSGPFLPPDASDASKHGASNDTPHTAASTIYRSLQDNPSTYKIAFIGVMDETHRFRSE